MHGGDDLLGVDALQVDAGRAEVGVPELALDDVERHAFAGELDGVGVAQLVRREAPPDTRLDSEPTELDPDPGARPGPAASGAVDDAEQRPDPQLDPVAEPGRQLLPSPPVRRKEWAARPRAEPRRGLDRWLDSIRAQPSWTSARAISTSRCFMS